MSTPWPVGLISTGHCFAAVFFLSPFFFLSVLINNSRSTKGDLHWLLLCCIHYLKCYILDLIFKNHLHFRVEK